MTATWLKRHAIAKRIICRGARWPSAVKAWTTKKPNDPAPIISRGTYLKERCQGRSRAALITPIRPFELSSSDRVPVLPLECIQRMPLLFCSASSPVHQKWLQPPRPPIFSIFLSPTVTSITLKPFQSQEPGVQESPVAQCETRSAALLAVSPALCNQPGKQHCE